MLIVSREESVRRTNPGVYFLWKCPAKYTESLVSFSLSTVYSHDSINSKAVNQTLGWYKARIVWTFLSHECL